VRRESLKAVNAERAELEIFEQEVTADSPLPFSIRQLWYHFDRKERVTYTDISRTAEALEKEGDAEQLQPARFKPFGMGNAAPFKPQPPPIMMNAVEPSKAGVASGILTMSRMVGGTFGVAAMGALITGLGKSRIDELLPAMSDEQRQKLADGLGAGGARVGGQVGDAVNQAFVYALNNGLRIGAAVAVLGAVLAWLLIADRAETPAEVAATEADVRRAETEAALAEVV